MKSDRGISLVWVEDGQPVVDAIGMYVDYLLDAFDSYTIGDLRQHCVDHFRREFQDVQTSTGDGTPLFASLKMMLVQVSRENLAKVDSESPRLFPLLMAKYKADPKGTMTMMLNAMSGAEEYTAQPLDRGDNEKLN